MAQRWGNFSENRTIRWLIVGAAGYSLVLVACFLTTLAVSSWTAQDAKVAERRATDTDSKPPQELLQVPNVDLMQLPPNVQAQQAKQQITQLVGTIRQKNQQQQDGYLIALLQERPDLAGLPFQMGGACRMNAGVSTSFGLAVGMVRDSIAREQQSIVTPVEPVSDYWHHLSQSPIPNRDEAGIAALTQIMGPEKTSRRQAVAEQLANVSHPKATRALAKQAVFDYDRRVRVAAIEGLKNRPRDEYTDILMQGVRYPWPAAAAFASQAIVKLERRDMVPQLVAFLDEADPRDPFEAKGEDGECEFKVRELVKVNHHRNCLMCHAPTTTAKQDEVPGLVPSPGEAFAPPTSKDAYGGDIPPDGPAIRADVTYLRQDFSVMQPVANAAPWPEMQRFDFLVRTRTINDVELADHVQKQKARGQNHLSENHKAALAALRQLTGRDAGTTAAAWRSALNLDAQARADKQ